MFSENLGRLVFVFAASLWIALFRGSALPAEQLRMPGSGSSAPNTQIRPGRSRSSRQPAAPPNGGSGNNAFPMAQSEAAAKAAAQQNQREPDAAGQLVQRSPTRQTGNGNASPEQVFAGEGQSVPGGAVQGRGQGAITAAAHEDRPRADRVFFRAVTAPATPTCRRRISGRENSVRIRSSIPLPAIRRRTGVSRTI